MAEYGEFELNCLDQELYDLATPAENSEVDSGVDDMNMDPTLEHEQDEYKLHLEDLTSMATKKMQEEHPEVGDGEAMDVDVEGKRRKRLQQSGIPQANKTQKVFPTSASTPTMSLT